MSHNGMFSATFYYNTSLSTEYKQCHMINEVYKLNSFSMIVLQNIKTKHTEIMQS